MQLNPSLEPIHRLTTSDEPIQEGATLTQFRVPDTGPYDVHGFASRDTLAGQAALGQILVFLDSAWNADAPEMRFPDGCAVTPTGDCDFSSMWTE